jgi:hypothetical protein
LSFESWLSCRSPRRSSNGGHAVHDRDGKGSCSPTGVEEHGTEAIGVSQELGRSCRLHRVYRRWGVAAQCTPGLPSLRSWTVGAKARRTEWYRQAKATERGGTDGRKSQRFIVPLIQGNLYRGDPGREGGASSRTFGQATRPGLCTWSTVSTQWPRIARRMVKP